jgi:DNA-binding NtrC family response regulator
MRRAHEVFEGNNQNEDNRLARCDENKTRTARYLGIPRHVLVYRLAKYSLR